MTVLHQLMPVSGEMRSKQFETWYGAPLPDDVRYGRNPQADELVEAFGLAGLDDLAIEKESTGKSWVVVVRDAASERLRIDAKQRGQEKENVLFTITGDRDILEYVIAHLPVSCGSYLITTDGQNPSIVTAGQ